MEVKAKLRFLRQSPKKVRLVINLLRGLPVTAALEQLQFLRKRAANPVLKLLNSAIANAENNFKLSKENLYIKKITTDEGPRLKRWRPRAFGRSTQILKRSSHITIILDELSSQKETKTTPVKSSKPGPVKKKLISFQEVKRQSKLKKKKRSPEGQTQPSEGVKGATGRITIRKGED